MTILRECGNGRVQDKVALVTGGATGLGLAIARCLVSEGAKVTITDVQRGPGESAAREMGCQFIEQDVTSEYQWADVVSQVEKRYESLHILVNNAGISGPFEAADAQTAKLEDWRAIYRINVEGVFLGCRTAIPVIARSGGGSIVNLSSTAGLGATPEFIAYGSSKAAVRHLSASVALHCARNRTKVRCNSVHPGIVRTSMFLGITENLAKKRNLSQQQVLDEFLAAIPQGEFQEPEDVASAVLFLCSDESKHVTGLAMVLDGGSTLAVRTA